MIAVRVEMSITCYSLACNLTFFEPTFSQIPSFSHSSPSFVTVTFSDNDAIEFQELKATISSHRLPIFIKQGAKLILEQTSAATKTCRVVLKIINPPSLRKQLSQNLMAVTHYRMKSKQNHKKSQK